MAMANMAVSIQQHIQNMQAYNPPLGGRRESQCLLLDFNERTIPVGEAVQSALINAVKNGALHLYPEYGNFAQTLAQYAGVKPSEVLHTTGSSQGIDVVCRAVASSGAQAIIPQPSFPMLAHHAALEGMDVLQPAYEPGGAYPLHAVLKSITQRTRLIVVCNPNNPTGTLVGTGHIASLASAAPQALILVDECYHEFCPEATAAALLNAHPNVVITRTFSKTWGLAALRIGYVLASEANIAQFQKIRGPYDVNHLAVVAANAALENPQYMHAYVREVNEISRPMFLNFLKAKGIAHWPSVTNFVLLEVPAADSISSALAAQHIRVRAQNIPGAADTLRITLGTPAQTKQLIAALETLL